MICKVLRKFIYIIEINTLQFYERSPNITRRTSKEHELKIIELYKQGNSMAKAGAEYNVSAATVLRILNEYGIPKRTKGGIYKIPDEDVIQRYKNGESCQQIADSYNVTFHTISNILEKII